jgi:hypothetical protein
MRVRTPCLGISAVVGALVAGATFAVAAPATFVSGTGTNAGACPVTAPCATFQFAHDQTDAGGAIVVVSSGSFGPVTITKGISIIAEGVEALIRTGTATCGTGGAGAAVCINAGAADFVYLQGLTIDLKGAVKNGIRFNTGSALHVQNSVIRNATGLGSGGIVLLPATATGLFVSDTTIADIPFGIAVAPAGNGSAKVVLVRVQSERHGLDGFIFTYSASGNGKITATVRDSAVSGASRFGIAAGKTGGGTQTIAVMVDRAAVVNGGTGVLASGSGVTVRIGDSTVTGNTTGLSATLGGVIAAFPTNKLEGNGNDSVEILAGHRHQ